MNEKKYSLTTTTCQHIWPTNCIQHDLFLGVEQSTVGCLVLNQAQQSSSPCFGQSANHGTRRPSLLAVAGGCHSRWLVMTLWSELLDHDH